MVCVNQQDGQGRAVPRGLAHALLGGLHEGPAVGQAGEHVRGGQADELLLLVFKRGVQPGQLVLHAVAHFHQPHALPEQFLVLAHKMRELHPHVRSVRTGVVQTGAGAGDDKLFLVETEGAGVHDA